MEQSKVMFSEAESSLLSNSEIILTKNRVIEGVVELFGEISTRLVSMWHPYVSIAPNAIKTIPKISKGEQYQSLPWVMLDYPRGFNKAEGYFAFRTFCWWGNYFTLQFICSGTYWQRQTELKNNLQLPARIGEYKLWSGDALDVWNNQCPQPGLISTSQKTTLQPFNQDGVYKLLVKVPLKDWQKMPETTCELTKLVINLHEH